jgi:hydroxypyruvate isomerase
MAFAGLGDNKEIGMNRLEYHDGFEASLRKYAPLAEKAGITSVITFSGPVFPDLNSEQGLRNTIVGLKRLAPIAADHGLTICMEPQNSKRDHPGYMCDTTAWGLEAVEAVGSPNAKLLYDVYHMQVTEGDVIETIRAHAQWFHHYHTGGAPGRHELDRKPGDILACRDVRYREHWFHRLCRPRIRSDKRTAGSADGGFCCL